MPFCGTACNATSFSLCSDCKRRGVQVGTCLKLFALPGQSETSSSPGMTSVPCRICSSPVFSMRSRVQALGFTARRGQYALVGLLGLRVLGSVLGGLVLRDLEVFK
eukprot:1612380-Amphidinium_carterae.1